MEELSHKTCTACGEVKPLSEFYAHPTGRGGLRPNCKACVRARSARRHAAYRAAHPRSDPEPSMAYKAIHLYLNAHFPKAGACDECGAQGRTHYALIHGREYSRNREDYRELCSPCHGQYDAGGERSSSVKLTADQVAEIRRRYTPSSGGGGKGLHPNSAESLAREFGVHRNTVANIVSGRSWKTLDGETEGYI